MCGLRRENEDDVKRRTGRRIWNLYELRVAGV
jgi:hypothetical protein